MNNPLARLNAADGAPTAAKPLGPTLAQQAIAAQQQQQKKVDQNGEITKLAVGAAAIAGTAWVTQFTTSYTNNNAVLLGASIKGGPAQPYSQITAAPTSATVAKTDAAAAPIVAPTSPAAGTPVPATPNPAPKTPSETPATATPAAPAAPEASSPVAPPAVSTPVVPAAPAVSTPAVPRVKGLLPWLKDLIFETKGPIDTDGASTQIAPTGPKVTPPALSASINPTPAVPTTTPPPAQTAVVPTPSDSAAKGAAARSWSYDDEADENDTMSSEEHPVPVLTPASEKKMFDRARDFLQEFIFGSKPPEPTPTPTEPVSIKKVLGIGATEFNPNLAFKHDFPYNHKIPEVHEERTEFDSSYELALHNAHNTTELKILQSRDDLSHEDQTRPAVLQQKQDGASHHEPPTEKAAPRPLPVEGTAPAVKGAETPPAAPVEAQDSTKAMETPPAAPTPAEASAPTPPEAAKGEETSEPMVFEAPQDDYFYSDAVPILDDLVDKMVADDQLKRLQEFDHVYHEPAPTPELTETPLSAHDSELSQEMLESYTPPIVQEDVAPPSPDELTKYSTLYDMKPPEHSSLIEEPKVSPEGIKEYLNISDTDLPEEASSSKPGTSLDELTKYSTMYDLNLVEPQKIEEAISVPDIAEAMHDPMLSEEEKYTVLQTEPVKSYNDDFPIRLKPPSPKVSMAKLSMAQDRMLSEKTEFTPTKEESMPDDSFYEDSFPLLSQAENRQTGAKSTLSEAISMFMNHGETAAKIAAGAAALGAAGYVTTKYIIPQLKDWYYKKPELTDKKEVVIVD